MHAAAIEKLIESFEQLPGVGRKSAERIAFYILEQMSTDDAASMAGAITAAKENIKFCSLCQNLTDTDPCKICSSPKRDKSVICVVESPEDVNAIEATNEYKGVYHVLHGALSPMDGITPDDIKINFSEGLNRKFNRHLYDPATVAPNEKAEIIPTDKTIEADSCLCDSLPAYAVAVYTTMED